MTSKSPFIRTCSTKIVFDLFVWEFAKVTSGGLLMMMKSDDSNSTCVIQAFTNAFRKQTKHF